MSDIEYLREEAQRCRLAADAAADPDVALKFRGYAEELERLAVAMARDELRAPRVDI